jgi:predicted ATPase
VEELNMNKQNNNLFVVTGSPGSGKSTILNILKQLDFKIVAEPAREIISEQQAIQGKGLYDNDKALFVELMLSRSIYQYEQMLEIGAPVIFDRGIPDNIGYASLFGVDTEVAKNTANTFRYNQKVFFTPSWKEIYREDQDRKISFEEADAFGEIIRGNYTSLGYEILEIPRGTPNSRARFVLNNIFDLVLKDENK